MSPVPSPWDTDTQPGPNCPPRTTHRVNGLIDATEPIDDSEDWGRMYLPMPGVPRVGGLEVHCSCVLVHDGGLCKCKEWLSEDDVKNGVVKNVELDHEVDAVNMVKVWLQSMASQQLLPILGTAANLCLAGSKQRPRRSLPLTEQKWRHILPQQCKRHESVPYRSSGGRANEIRSCILSGRTGRLQAKGVHMGPRLALYGKWGLLGQASDGGT
ncbi:hypothetical protein K503DRAFT_833127 [Rhizopogon vinicolor AM-OR11-026]|uniref:Uncharacterized protein n=1 Tax=Rhizopogon vinicolor AM-OR11-026 TaxID=1314800 RepID=A0A1B7NAK8_9AGAM|nr:hypothetical protein K503DRAFT_833127 [Rhizopogon vinicolor AM-OR11-026]